MIRLAPDVAMDVVKQIRGDWMFAARARDDCAADWKKARAQVNCEFYELAAQKNTNVPQNLAHFYVPITLKHIHRTQSEFVGHYFPDSELNLLDVQARDNGSEMDGVAAEMVNQIVRAKVEVELGESVQRALQDAHVTGLIDGTGVLKGGWLYRRMSGESRALIENVPGEHCCWDPWALAPAHIRYFVHELWLTEDELWEGARAGYYDPQVVQRMTREDRGDEHKQGDDPWRETLHAGGASVRRFHALEYWGPQQLLGTHEIVGRRQQGREVPFTDVVATVHGAGDLLRLEENPYAKLYARPSPLQKLPFFLVTPLPKLNSTRGNSLVLWIRELQREINLTRNQRRKAVDLEMTRRTFYDFNRITNVRLMERARYGGYVPSDGNPRDAVYDQQFITSTQNMVQEEGKMELEVEEITGVNPQRLGMAGPGDETATAAQIRSVQGNANQDALISNCDAAIRSLMSFYAECAIEYTSPREAQEILGSATPPPPLKTILKRRYQMRLRSGRSAASKAQHRRDLEYALEHVSRISNMMPEIGGPAALLILGELLPALGVPKAGRLFEMAAAQMGQGGSPAGAGQEAPPGYGDQMARTAQGRVPSPQEGRLAVAAPA